MRFDREFWKEVTANIAAKKRRSMMTGAGVAGAIFFLVVLMAAGDGLEKGVKNRFKGVSPGCIYIYPGYARLPFAGNSSGREIKLDYSDYESLMSKLKEKLQYASCRTDFDAIKELRAGAMYTQCHLSSAEPTCQYTHPVSMLEGHYISEVENARSERVIIIGKTLKEDLFKDHKAIGKYVVLDNIYYKVTGVFGSLKDGQGREYDDNLAIIPCQVYRDVYDPVGSLSNIALIPWQDDYEYVRAEVETVMQWKKGIAKDDGDAITIYDSRKDFNKYRTLFRNINIFLLMVSTGILCLGLMNISNVVMITVNERFFEIGVRKALGATPRDIMGMVMAEAMLLTLLSGLSGLCTSILFVHIISLSMRWFELNNEFFMQPSVDIKTVLISMLLLCCSGTLAGIIPAGKASRIKPIQALKHE